MNISKNQLNIKLHSNIMRTTFIKKDGTIRNMLCTKQPNLYHYEPKTKNPVDYPHLITVYDLENNDFRNITINNIQSMSFEKKVRGLHFDKQRKKYIARKQINGKRTYIGSFETYQQAVNSLENVK